MWSSLALIALFLDQLMSFPTVGNAEASGKREDASLGSAQI
jgi:hypothetical protein